MNWEGVKRSTCNEKHTVMYVICQKKIAVFLYTSVLTLEKGNLIFTDTEDLPFLNVVIFVGPH
jgi:vancomycin permeability regulator SanA